MRGAPDEKKQEERSVSLLKREETAGGRLLFGGDGKYKSGSRKMKEQNEQGPDIRVSERSEECTGDSALAPGGPTLRAQRPPRDSDQVSPPGPTLKNQKYCPRKAGTEADRGQQHLQAPWKITKYRSPLPQIEVQTQETRGQMRPQGLSSKQTDQL